ncbi:MAG: response regulator, partial [Dehalococcoidia bacterium]
MDEKIRIIIAEDHTLVREGTRQLLDQQEDMVVVGEAADGEEAVRIADALRPDVAIIDIAMPKLNGIEATRQIKALHPATAVLILTAYDDDPYIFALLEAGAAGYLLKDVRSRELVEAVREVHAGESVLHPAIARKVLSRFRPPPGGPAAELEREPLTAREREVLLLAARGLSNKEVA